MKYIVITIPMHMKRFARVERGAKYLRFLTNELRSIGSKATAMCKWTSKTNP